MKLKTTGIYKITNTKENKSYIGQSKNVFHRWGSEAYGAFSPSYDEYNSLLSQAIRKFGIENFEVEVVEECDEKDLLIREQYYIQFFNTLEPNGYNKAKKIANITREKITMYDVKGNIQMHFEKTKDAVSYLIEEGSLSESCEYSIGRDLALAFKGERQVVCGHRWSYYGQEIQLSKDSSKKEVYLLDNDTFSPLQKFFSCGDAAKFLGCTTSTLAKHCRGETDSCMGKLLCYVENYEERKKTWEENKTAINLNRNIYILKNGELVGTANTYAEASRFVGGTGKSANISRIINGKGTYKGHTFLTRENYITRGVA